MLVFTIIFILISVLLFLVYPIAGYLQMQKLKKSKEKKYEKSNWYFETIIWSWVPVILVLALIPVSGMKLSDMGFKWINFKSSSFGSWIIWLSVVVYLIYLLYNIYSIVVLKYNKEARIKAGSGIPDDYRLFLPVSPKEKRIWTYVAISAGITEEVVYRGFLFYALSYVFPGLSMLYVLAISTFLFGIGHIYQGTEAIKPTIIGLFFGFFYIVTGSLIPIVIAHVAQDMVVKYLFNEETV